MSLPKKKRAIVLDDDSKIRDLLESVIGTCGYSVVSYESPCDEAIYKNPEVCPALSGRTELFSASPACAELIISDVKMPTVTGLEYVRKIRQAGCGVRHIAMMSGMWTADTLAEAEDLGCAIFSKPFTVRSLREWVNSLEY